MHLFFPVFIAAVLGMFLPSAVFAQVTTGTRSVIQLENVHTDYARVLAVQPVYQTLKASRTEMRCDEKSAPVTKAAPASSPNPSPSRWDQWMSSVKSLLGSKETPVPALAPAKAKETAVKINCRMTPVEREFRRPIAYDVDYVYKGMKYRATLPKDPGSRLQIRVSVMPYSPIQAATRP